MLIEIFEVKGSSEISTDLDVLILDLYKKSHGEIELKKIDVLDKNQIKPYKDVIEIIKVRGLEALPVIKANGKIVTEQKLQQLLRR